MRGFLPDRFKTRTLRRGAGLACSIRARLCEAAVLHLPSGALGNRAKFVALKAGGAKVSWPLHIDSGVWIRNVQNFRSGPGLVLSKGAVLNCSTDLEVGSNCLVGYGAFVGTAMHNVPPSVAQDIAAAGHTHAPIRIGDGCWVGAHACVLAGVTLGRGVVVGAGSVVTRDCEEGAIVAGPPAAVLRHRDRR